MKTILTLAVVGWMFVPGLRAALVLARDGRAQCVILEQAGATEPERNAAKELAETLRQISGAEFAVETVVDAIAPRAIVVGPGPAAREVFPEVPFDQLGPEEIVIKTKGERLLLAGGRPRGTLYAVSQFLQEQCGVRWWTPWASQVPKRGVVSVEALDVRYQPPFETRDPFWYPAFDARWAVRNFSNSQSANIPAERGEAIRYKGFVHTFYPLVPPEQHFAAHPEWYSLIKGKRTHDHAQLCLTNPDLRKFVVERVKQWLKESPEARILSVSQNDWHGACECERCKALDEAEGSHAGTLLEFVNHVAEQIEPDFPQVAIDTLAYQYTRKPPKSIRPRPNVIVRLCSIECNFRDPLEHVSNAAFADDIRGWAQICKRLYIWDYTTDFAHYVQPHPNWFVLGPNVRFFAAHNVRGLFEQGAYQAYGSEMGELRAWVLAQLLWNPARNDIELIDTFLKGYYGKDAAPYIRSYLDLMQEASKGYNLTCFSKTDTPFHSFATLARAEQLWQQAEQVAANQAEYLPRIRMGRLPLRYAWLVLWEKLRKECADTAGHWPLPLSRKAVADEWLKGTQGVPGLDWTRIKLINEGGLTPEKFVERFAQDPPEPKTAALPRTDAAAARATAQLSQKLPRIQVAPDGRGFTTELGQPFVPMGVSYFRPGTGWAPQVWKQFDPEATRRDFARLRELGANCVRVFLSYGSFYSDPGSLRPEGLEKFDRFLELAEAAGIYVHPTGPDHWEGMPDWAKGDRYADPKALEAVEQFWALFAARYKGRNAIFAYDLLNEPEIRWDTPALRARWDPWVKKRYPSTAEALAAWGVTGKPPEAGGLPVPPRDAASGRHLADYQRFREDVAEEWLQRQVRAIRHADATALVTVGLIQWSVPVNLAGPFQYAAFRPARVAPWVDFLELHFYPLAQGFYEYAGDEAEARNLAYLECLTREVAGFGKPVVIAEFGWYGGGKPKIDGDKHAAASEDQQARWCRRVIETTAGIACGWLNWGLHDHPGAGDVTELTGLLTAGGTVKAWGRTFQELAARFREQGLPAPPVRVRPALDWDAVTADRAAADRFKEAYWQSYRADGAR
jgi:hypothetical protein